MMFSALTFNMQNGQVWDDERPDDTLVRIEETIAFLSSQDADILFLQEVERGHEGGRQADPPPHYTLLKEALTGYDSVFAYPIPNDEEIPFGLGLAIFSKTPLKDFRRIDLPPADIVFEYGGIQRHPSHRLIIEAHTEIGGHRVRLLNTHLQAFFMINASSNDHRRQRDLVEKAIQGAGGATILAGDFNSAPEETLVQQFEDAGFRTAQTAEVTWKRMPFVLDHIFYNAPIKLESCSVLSTGASDHHAVRTEFSFSS